MKMRSVAPIFLVDDVDKTMDWYSQKLGFKGHPFKDDKSNSVFAILAKDHVEIFLKRFAGYKKESLCNVVPEGVWDVYIRMDDVEGFYNSVRDHVTVKRELNTKGYGDTEFEIEDCNGYIIGFGEVIKE